MRAWFPLLVIAVFTAIAVVWLGTRAVERDLRIPYEPIFEIVETLSVAAEDEIELPGRIRVEIRIIEATERLWVANILLCLPYPPLDRDALVRQIYRLHEELAMLKRVILQTRSTFRYDQLSFCGIPAFAVPSQRPIP